MRLLVFGGSAFVGRTVVNAALDRGWEVTVFNRGTTAHDPRGHRIVGDRTVHDDVARLKSGTWDAVVDTWAGAPRVVSESAAVLSDRVDRYLYVSSRAVYSEPTSRDMDETALTVEASADADAEAYGVDKRGGEMAVERAFGGSAILARAGLILGPLENVGRLPYWLQRVADGGRQLAPGPPDLPWRFIDVRDLARWMLDALDTRQSGPFNLVAPLGHASTGSLLDVMREVTGSTAEFVWVDHDAISSAGISRWDAFPGWIPPTPAMEGMIWTDTTKAQRAGLACRPAVETVMDVWRWLQDDLGGVVPTHPDHPHGIDPDAERRLLER